ncbi:histidinol-phosphate transaminase [Chromatocurvus halotolerans]|uniref:Histidinol-phosphate aminotransferase n=1 Tax=Chromatocurvus halotolerans TaxID=1132028 RepID=A0A4V2SC27_9GAMM|nr:histidinol-phosphate transaminase [Chromatocurvus halotolerans]TCO77810.1 histidinol-phosphate aminotransferase [Chromatocurvus halotolerans]
MSRFWSDTARRLVPYVPGEQPRETLIKLNTNECPYPPSPRVMRAIQEVGGDELRRYPNPESDALRCAVADYHRIEPSQVFPGNGSDEVLAHIFQGLLKQQRPLVFPDITYSFYPVWCALYDIDYETLPLTEDFRIDVGAIPRDNGGIIFPNPNAPTGCPLPLAEIRRVLLGHPDSVVVVDEAYVDFGAESAIPLIRDFPNLVVVQTLSKARSLAGLRVGFAFAQAELVEALLRVKNSFNSYPLDVFAQRGAVAAYQDEAYFQECRARVIASREQLALALSDLGYDVLPSAANFLLVSPPGGDAAALFGRLRERGILVRHFSRPRIDRFLRISIGSEEECATLLGVLKELS